MHLTNPQAPPPPAVVYGFAGDLYVMCIKMTDPFSNKEDKAILIAYFKTLNQNLALSVS
jgi:hypothetical protein